MSLQPKNSYIEDTENRSFELFKKEMVSFELGSGIVARSIEKIQRLQSQLIAISGGTLTVYVAIQGDTFSSRNIKLGFTCIGISLILGLISLFTYEFSFIIDDVVKRQKEAREILRKLNKYREHEKIKDIESIKQNILDTSYSRIPRFITRIFLEKLSTKNTLVNISSLTYVGQFFCFGVGVICIMLGIWKNGTL